MCDYCGCRSIPEIGTLSLDHERIQSIMGRLRRLIAEARPGGEEVDRLLHDVQADLEPHTDREEAGLYTVYREVGLDFDYAKRFVDDHADIADLLTLAFDDHTAITELLKRLDRHILEEESDVFPAASQLFSGSDWAEVDRRLVAAGLADAID